MAQKPLAGRLPRWGILGACLGFAIVAKGAHPLPFAEDFEAPLTANMPIHQMGAWQSGPADASKVVSNSYTFTATTRPIVPSADVQVLHLDTQTDAANLPLGIPDADQVLYLDGMLNLLPRSEIPEAVTDDPSVQLFFYLNTDTNLVVYNGGIDGTAPTLTVLPGLPLAPGDWNRYTVTLDFANGDGGVERTYFKLQLNGTDVTSPQAYSAPGLTGAFDGGAWFFAADQTGPDCVDSMSFKGIGDLDDLVVTTRAPLFTPTRVHYIVSDLVGPGTLSPQGDIPVVEGSSTQVVYQADPWHEISDVRLNGTPVPAAVGEQVFTAAFVNVQSAISNVVQFAETVAAVDGNTPASWYGPLGADPSLADEDGDGLTLYEEYRLNSHPTISNEFTIADCGLVGQTPWLSWDSLGLPNGPMISEVSTSLTEDSWQSQRGFLSYNGYDTVWRSSVVFLEPTFFLRMSLAE